MALVTARLGQEQGNNVAFLRTARPEPPENLTDEEAVQWRRYVNCMPADWFSVEVQPLLAQLCGHVVLANQLRARLMELQRELSRDTRASKEVWAEITQVSDMNARETDKIVGLSRQLRLTNQSRYDPTTARIKSKASGEGTDAKPWIRRARTAG